MLASRSNTTAFSEKQSTFDELLQARAAQPNEIASGFRRASFNKSTNSPLKTSLLNKTHTPSPQPQPQPQISPPQHQSVSEEIEMLSCSSSSSSSSSSPSSAASSFKENMLNRNNAVQEQQQQQLVSDTNASNIDNYNSDSNASTNEPSKLSLSEKMKLFSNLNNKNANQASLKAKTNTFPSRSSSNRFSTQVIYVIKIMQRFL
jgi:hypothetical protein